MSDTLTGITSQTRFEEALRKHLARRRAIGSPDVNTVREGFDLSVLDAIHERLELSQEMLERILGVSARTLQRRRAAGQRLTIEESDRLWRLMHVFNLALQAFGDDHEAAQDWLTTSKPLLDGETPLDRLDTEPGLREVEDMLTVIDETAAA